MRGHICNISQPVDLAPALESEKTILICDSATQEDLEALARAAQELPGLLYAGSAGLAQALANLNRTRTPVLLVPPAERTLLVAGTSHPVTRLQLDSLDPAFLDRAQVFRINIPLRIGARIRSEFESYAPQALVLTGGDTALLAVRALEAHSFILQGELAPGVPWGIVQGGVAHGCTVVTKSGGFGSRSLFNEILTAFQGKA
jgi:uncharacterized protein YgbK (DUF1537 family)